MEIGEILKSIEAILGEDVMAKLKPVIDFITDLISKISGGSGETTTGA